MDLDKALQDLLDVHTERIEHLLRRHVAGVKFLDENVIINLELEWGLIGPFSRCVVPGSDCDQILFLRAILRDEGAFFANYIPVRHIDFDDNVFTDDQLCRETPDVHWG